MSVCAYIMSFAKSAIHRPWLSILTRQRLCLRPLFNLRFAILFGIDFKVECFTTSKFGVPHPTDRYNSISFLNAMHCFAILITNTHNKKNSKCVDIRLGLSLVRLFYLYILLRSNKRALPKTPSNNNKHIIMIILLISNQIECTLGIRNERFSSAQFRAPLLPIYSIYCVCVWDQIWPGSGAGLVRNVVIMREQKRIYYLCPIHVFSVYGMSRACMPCPAGSRDTNWLQNIYIT